MNILQTILQNHPIRRTDAQKQAFQSYVLEHCSTQGVSAKVEELDKNQNIIIGDPKTAKVILTAHYDTPASSIYPNMLIPQNRFFRLLYHLSIPIAIALICLWVAYGVSGWLNVPNAAPILYLVLYFGVFFLLTRTFVNQHNANDNTSGVVTVLILATAMREDLKEKGIACILFDNEEKGLKGSKAFSKTYKSHLNDTLVLNFDCVGDGEHFLFVAKPEAEANPIFQSLKANLHPTNACHTVFLSSGKASCNSDQKNFPQGVGIVACHKYPLVGYATGKIHTRRDTTCDPTNIDYLVSSISSVL